MNSRFALAMFFVTGVFVQSAHAQVAPLAHLRFERAPEAENCPDEDAFRNARVQHFGSDPFGADSQTVISIRFLRESDHLRASLAVMDAQTGELIDHSELTSDDFNCVELAALAGQFVNRTLESMRDAVSDNTVSNEAAENLPEPEEDEAVRRHKLIPSIELGIGGSKVMMPSIAPYASARASLAYGSFAAGVAVMGFPYSHMTYTATGSVHSTFYGGRVYGCFKLDAFDACAVVTAGKFEASAPSVPSLSYERMIVLGGLEARSGWVLDASWKVEVSLGANVPFMRATLATPGGPLWQAPLWEPYLEVGIAYAFR